jgi:hypothetical protein
LFAKLPDKRLLRFGFKRSQKSRPKTAFCFSLLTAHPFQTAATLKGAGLVIN